MILLKTHISIADCQNTESDCSRFGLSDYSSTSSADERVPQKGKGKIEFWEKWLNQP